MNKVLLVGNDINNINSRYSWDELINDLMDSANLKKKLSKKDKPFPMLYEEIYLNAARQNGLKELSIKKRIAANTQNLQPNEIHHRICQLGIEHILTTNYDLTLEKSLSLDPKKITNQGCVKENLYSLFRHHAADDQKIWHIHGSETSPQSITLGYEHYSGYLQQMRNYVAHGTKGVYKHIDFPPLAKRLRDKPFKSHSWVDIFFTHDIHILGLNLDFVEMHLWWLLTFRTRAMLQNRFKLTNTITYYYPKKYQEASQYKLDLLEVSGVRTVPIHLQGENRMAYYHRVIDEIEKGGR